MGIPSIDDNSYIQYQKSCLKSAITLLLDANTVAPSVGLLASSKQMYSDGKRPALMRDTTKLFALGRVTPAVTKAQIQVYSPAGEGLLLFSVDASPIFRWNDRLISV